MISLVFFWLPTQFFWTTFMFHWFGSCIESEPWLLESTNRSEWCNNVTPINPETCIPSGLQKKLSTLESLPTTGMQKQKFTPQPWSLSPFSKLRCGSPARFSTGTLLATAWLAALPLVQSRSFLPDVFLSMIDHCQHQAASLVRPRQNKTKQNKTYNVARSLLYEMHTVSSRSVEEATPSQHPAILLPHSSWLNVTLLGSQSRPNVDRKQRPVVDHEDRPDAAIQL